MTKSSIKTTSSANTVVLNGPTDADEERPDLHSFTEHLLESAPNGYEPSEQFLATVYAGFCEGNSFVIHFEPEVIELHFGPVPGRHTIH